MLSLACDYRVMTDGSSRNAWLSMNEVRLFLSHVMTTLYPATGPFWCSVATIIHCHSTG